MPRRAHQEEFEWKWPQKPVARVAAQISIPSQHAPTPRHSHTESEATGGAYGCPLPVGGAHVLEHLLHLAPAVASTSNAGAGRGGAGSEAACQRRSVYSGWVASPHAPAGSRASTGAAVGLRRDEEGAWVEWDWPDSSEPTAATVLSIVPSPPKGPGCGCQRKTSKSVKIAVGYTYIIYITVVLVKSAVIAGIAARIPVLGQD